METDVDPMIDLVDFQTPTPLEKVLASITESVGLDFWMVGDTYHIGNKHLVDATPLASKGKELTLASPESTNTAQQKAPKVMAQYDGAASNDKSRAARVINSSFKQIVLEHTSVSEVMYAFGLSDEKTQIDRNQKRVMHQRIQTILDPRQSSINLKDTSAYSPSRGNMPTYSGIIGNVSRDESATDSYQLGGPLGGPPWGGPNPGLGNPNPNPNPNPNIAPNANNNNNNANRTGLARFLPEDIQFDVIGLNGHNSLLVKATAENKEDAEQAIDDLETLIKFLDKPVKQVIVEAMFVKMEVKDAMSIGASWEYGGMPISITSQNGGAEGNFALRYVSGNIRASLATLLTTSTAKVVNAPRSSSKMDNRRVSN